MFLRRASVSKQCGRFTNATCCDASQAGVLKLLGCLKEKIADARGVRAIAMLSVTNAGSQALQGI